MTRDEALNKARAAAPYSPRQGTLIVDILAAFGLLTFDPHNAGANGEGASSAAAALDGTAVTIRSFAAPGSLHYGNLTLDSAVEIIATMERRGFKVVPK